LAAGGERVSVDNNTPATLPSSSAAEKTINRFELRRLVNAAVLATEERRLIEAHELKVPTLELEPPLSARADVLRVMRLQAMARNGV
jgi:hypothetical protein